jgi:hypothetical protein
METETTLFAQNPELAAVVIAVIGIFAARFLAKLADRGILQLERTLRHLVQFRIDKDTFSRLQPVFRGLVYYTTLLVFLLSAVQMLGFDATEHWLTALLGYVPQLLLAGLIIISGYLLGVLTRGLVAGLLGEKSGHLLPRIAQVVVVTASVLTGLGQMSLDLSFITDVVVILLAAFVGGLSVAFALGSKNLVANLLARRDLERYRIGQRIQVDGVEGRIADIQSTAVLLETAEGTTAIPAAKFSVANVTLLHTTTVEEESTGGE